MLRGADKRLFVSGQLSDVLGIGDLVLPGRKHGYSTAAAYDAAVLASLPTVYWKLEDASGLPQDSSPNAFHFTNAPNLLYSQDGPWYGWKGIRFVSSAYANRSAVTQLTTGFTIEYWIKIAALTGDITFFRDYRDATARGWQHRYDAATGQFFWAGYGGGSTSANSAAVLTGGAWHHVAIVVASESSVTFYVDGVADTPSPSGASYSGPMVTSALAEVGTSADLTVSRFAIYPTALAESVVTNHFDIARGAA